MPKPKLHADSFEELIGRRGRPVAWEEAAICSCWNIDSGQPSYTCKACHGKGYVYQPATEAKALVTSITLNKDFEAMAGVFDVGDAVMTVPNFVPATAPATGYVDNPMFEIGLWDKITLLDDEYKTSEVLIYGQSLNGRDPDTLMNVATKLKHVRAYDQDTGETTTYTKDVDFSLVNSQFIDWSIGTNRPAIGQQYSVTYFHKPVYIVTATLPKPRHQDGQDFPRYVALRYLNAGVERK